MTLNNTKLYMLNKEEVIESLEKLVILCEKAEKENKIIRCRKLTVKLADNREER